MEPQRSTLETKSLELCNFRELLEDLASDAVMPGAGTAGGIALALAAACAGKAVAITLRHDPGDPGKKELQQLQQRLAYLRSQAITLAEADALQFKRHLKSGSAQATDALLRTDRQLLDHCDTLDVLLRQYEDRIAPNMNGDWQAARSLTATSRFIEQQNIQELAAG